MDRLDENKPIEVMPQDDSDPTEEIGPIKTSEWIMKNYKMQPKKKWNLFSTKKYSHLKFLVKNWIPNWYQVAV